MFWSGNGTYVPPVRVNSLYSAMLCPTSTTITNGGRPSSAGRLRAYLSAWFFARCIASSQARVPRKPWPRRLGAANPGNSVDSSATRLAPCLASSTKHPRL